MQSSRRQWIWMNARKSRNFVWIMNRFRFRPFVADNLDDRDMPPPLRGSISYHSVDELTHSQFGTIKYVFPLFSHQFEFLEPSRSPRIAARNVCTKDLDLIMSHLITNKFSEFSIFCSVSNNRTHLHGSISHCLFVNEVLQLRKFPKARRSWFQVVAATWLVTLLFSLFFSETEEKLDDQRASGYPKLPIPFDFRTWFRNFFLIPYFLVLFWNF